MSKYKINILSRNETNRNTSYIDDLKINVARKHQSQGGLIQNFCVNKFGVFPILLSLLAKAIANFFTRIYQ